MRRNDGGPLQAPVMDAQHDAQVRSSGGQAVWGITEPVSGRAGRREPPVPGFVVETMDGGRPAVARSPSVSYLGGIPHREVWLEVQAFIAETLVSALRFDRAFAATPNGN